MEDKRMITWRKIVFELRLLAGNPYINIFGVGFPVFLACMISRAVIGEISDAGLAKQATTQIFLGLGTIIPMATVLIGYATSRAVEIEKGVGERMSLFGITVMETVGNRIVAQLIFMMVAFGIYFTVGGTFGYLLAPKSEGLVLYVVCIVALTVILFALGHSIASLCRKFGLTYMVSMLIYFMIMVFSGMMGMNYDQFPTGMKAVARLLPTTYINDSDYVGAWIGKGYHYGSIVQAFLFLSAVAGILLFAAWKREQRK